MHGCPSSLHSLRQHTSAYKSIRDCPSSLYSLRQHTSAYARIRQHTRLSQQPAWLVRRKQCSIATSAYVSIRQHTSSYVIIRQQTPACVSICQHTPAYARTRQHTSAHVSIRQHTPAHVSIRQHTGGACAAETSRDSHNRPHPSQRARAACTTSPSV
jgi:hypothetical protein